MRPRLLIPAVALSWLALLGAGTNGTSSATVSWQAPTTYTDGEALPASEIAFYTVQWTGGGTATQTKVVNAPGLSTVVAAICGSVSFTVSVTTTATAKYPNATSAPAGPVPFVSSSASCTPNPPVAVTVK